MATARPKESNTIGKEKKTAPSFNAHHITKKTTKPSTTSTATTSSSDKTAISTDKVPNYLKPTISSRNESRSQLLKQPKIKEAPQKPAAASRRRSFDRPPSKLPAQNQPSASRLHKALVSPGPRQRVVSTSSRVSSTLPVKSVITSSKPISDKTSGKFRDAKTQPFFAKGAVKKSGSATVTQKASVRSTDTRAPKSHENAEAVNVELPEREIKEASHEEDVVKVEEDVHEHEGLAVAEDHVNAADHDIEESYDDQHRPPIDEAEDEKEIPAVEEVDEVHLQEEKPEHIEHEKDEKNTDYDVNKSINDDKRADEGHAVTEEESEVIEQKEGGAENSKDTEHLEEEEEKKEKVESHEEVDDLKEREVEAEESNKNDEAAAPSNVQAGRTENNASRVSNDVIEETTSKLLEARKNKVRALAGAFQNVIDHQAKR